MMMPNNNKFVTKILRLHFGVQRIIDTGHNYVPGASLNIYKSSLISHLTFFYRLRKVNWI